MAKRTVPRLHGDGRFGLLDAPSVGTAHVSGHSYSYIWESAGKSGECRSERGGDKKEQSREGRHKKRG